MTAPRMTLSVLLLVAILAAWGCQSRGERDAQGPPVKLSLAVVPFSYSGLIAIADDKGFFRESGLEVSTKEYPSGLAAVEALCRGEAEMATGMDLVFAIKIYDEPSLRAVASIGLSNANEIVARKDRNIHEPRDLKGKRIGISLNTSSEYYLGTFLLINGISASEVTTVNIPPTGIAEALEGGEVDAISSWDINVYNAKKLLGENAVSWPAQNNTEWQWVLAVKESLTRSPEAIKRFLTALIKAEDFLLNHEEEAKKIIMRKWGFDSEFMQQIWDKTRLNVTIDQSLIISLENSSRWKMTKEGKSGDVPNFLNYIYTGALEEIDPRVVRIFK